MSIFEKAFERHQAGHWQEANTLYESLVQTDPNHADAWHLWGVLALQTQNEKAAEKRLTRALALSPNNALYLGNLGNLYQSQNRPEQALECYQKALKADAQNPDLHYNMAGVLTHLNKHTLALKHYQKSMQFRPGFVDAALACARLHMELGQGYKAEQLLKKTHKQVPDSSLCFELGLVLQAQQKYPEALAAYQEAHNLAPRDPKCLNNAGYVLQLLGQPTQAFELYQRALALAPDYVAPLLNMGTLFESQADSEQALKAYQEVLKREPGHFQAHFHMGALLLTQHQYTSATTHFEHCLVLAPKHADTLVQLGNIAESQGQPEKAKTLYEEALQAQPEHAGARFNLGILAREQGDFEPAQTLFEHLGDWGEAPFALGTLHLLQGRFKEGWPLYERRPGKPRFDLPLWQGESLKGKHLWVIGEQGFGDLIQMSRFLEHIDAKALTLWCSDALRPLFKICFPQCHWPDDFSQRPDADAYLPWMSLPGLFCPDESAIPAPAHWPLDAKELPQRAPDKKALGLVWATGYQPQGEAHQMYLKKSLPLNAFQSLLENPEFQWYSLQIGKDALQSPHPHLLDLAPHIQSFLETAQYIQSLDGVVTTDTAVAHLAGTLGKPVWVLLPFVPDWRWLTDRSDSPWYPGMALLRQSAPGVWEPVLKRLSESLKEFVHASP